MVVIELLQREQDRPKTQVQLVLRVVYIQTLERIKKSILNGVSVNLKFFQSNNDFRLLRLGTENYKLKITSAIIKVCFVSLHLSVIVAHNEALKISPALYPF